MSAIFKNQFERILTEEELPPVSSVEGDEAALEPIKFPVLLVN